MMVNDGVVSHPAEEHRLMMFENRALRRIFDRIDEEVARG
jgi:hypothetical protein